MQIVKVSLADPQGVCLIIFKAVLLPDKLLQILIV